MLPSGLVGVRQFGFLANRVRKQKLELCRALLAARHQPPAADADDSAAVIVTDPQHCPVGKLGRMILFELLGAEPIAFPDTS